MKILSISVRWKRKYKMLCIFYYILFPETSMGTQLSDKTEDAWKAYKDAIYELGPYFFQRFTRVYLYFDIIFYLTSLWRKMKKPLKSLHGFTSTVIKERKIYVEQNGVKFGEDVNDDDLYIYKKRRKTAMLDLLIAAQKDGEIDDHGIQEEVDTFMFEVRIVMSLRKYSHKYFHLLA